METDQLQTFACMCLSFTMHTCVVLHVSMKSDVTTCIMQLEQVLQLQQYELRLQGNTCLCDINVQRCEVGPVCTLQQASRQHKVWCV